MVSWLSHSLSTWPPNPSPAPNVFAHLWVQTTLQSGSLASASRQRLGVEMKLFKPRCVRCSEQTAAIYCHQTVKLSSLGEKRGGQEASSSSSKAILSVCVWGGGGVMRGRAVSSSTLLVTVSNGAPWPRAQRHLHNIFRLRNQQEDDDSRWRERWKKGNIG